VAEEWVEADRSPTEEILMRATLLSPWSVRKRVSRQPVHLRAKPKDIADLVVTAGDPDRIQQLAGMLKDARLVNSNRGFITYTGYHKGRMITLATHGIGGPSSAIVFEELYMLGAKEIVRFGSTGALTRKLSIGDFIVPTGAGYDSGSLGTYARDGILPAVPNIDLTNRIVRNCEAEGAKYMTGPVFSTDAFYGEDAAFAERWSGRGVIGVEMECATLFALGLLRGFKAASLLIVSDSLVKKGQKKMAPAEELAEHVEKAGRIVLNALTSTSTGTHSQRKD
jgi:5'-methylthioadenosine phosphorylase